MADPFTERLEAAREEMLDPDSRRNQFSIELDCPPGNPRPPDLFPGVLKGTGLSVDDFHEPTKFFGNFTWVLRADVEKDELFTAAKPTFKERIAQLYNQGFIRYGSW